MSKSNLKSVHKFENKTKTQAPFDELTKADLTLVNKVIDVMFYEMFGW